MVFIPIGLQRRSCSGKGEGVPLWAAWKRARSREAEACKELMRWIFGIVRSRVETRKKVMGHGKKGEEHLDILCTLTRKNSSF